MAQKKHRFTKIFVVCGLIVLTAALVLFIAGMSAANWDFSKLSTVQYSVLTFEQTGGSGANRLTASTDVGDIELYFAE